MSETTEATKTKTAEPDVLEQAIDDALKTAYRDGPEWVAVRKAVEELKADRRKAISETPAETFERFTASVGRETDAIVKNFDAEVDRFATSAKALVTDVKGALERFIKKS